MDKQGTRDEVRAMYSRWPYPSPVAGKSLIFDLASLFQTLLPAGALDGREILDAGCGSGHRLVGFGKRFPRANFTGIDMTEKSLDVARKLAAAHGVKNVRFVKQDLLALDLDRTFDVITSTGVLHHLERPAVGLANLCRLLRDDGIMSVWLYHSIGEAERLRGRELLRTLWADKTNHAEGLGLMRALDLSLHAKQYGTSAAQSADVNQDSVDVDAYMHPIVEAYRLDEALGLFTGGSVDWAAVNGVNMLAESKLVDLEGVEDELLRPLCLQVEELLKTGELVSAYRGLGKREKLRVIELVTKPTGFTILAGRGRSLERMSARVRGNAVPVGDLARQA